jgi:hypothetical protein
MDSIRVARINQGALRDSTEGLAWSSPSAVFSILNRLMINYRKGGMPD